MSKLPRKILKLVLILVLVGPSLADQRWAPHAVAGPVNQLDIAGNACGPAALLCAYRCGSESWRSVSEVIPGKSDKSKLLYIIKAHGLRPSKSLQGRQRWTREGINVEDLSVVAGELAALSAQPKPRMESLLRKGREKPHKLLDRVHDRFRDSLKNGFPPVLSLRRYVRRQGQWHAVQGHFITIVRVPDRLPRGAETFDFTYFDPWGGKKETGRFSIPSRPVLTDASGLSSCVVASVPKANIGKSEVRSGEATEVVPTVVIGRW